MTSLRWPSPSDRIAFLAGLDRDLRAGLATEIRERWTHHSTALEGNSLTLGDTAFVLQEGLTISGKPLKDHQEVIGHARAIDLMYEFIAKRKPIAAADLHTLHHAVQTDAIIDIYNPVGRWKVEPDGTTALLSDGKRQWHDYAQPDNVPALMDTWLKNLAQMRGDRSDRLDAFTDMHLGFIDIHPYADGNGRMARLLANIPLIEGGMPPLLVPVERRRDYITLIGDWSIARGAPEPDAPLVPRLPERDRLLNFFREVARPSQDLVDAYRSRQTARIRL